MQVSPSKSSSKLTAHQNDVASDPLESVRRKAEKAFKVLSRRNSHASSNTPKDSSCGAAMLQGASSSGIKWCENNVLWNSLSSRLVQHGKVYIVLRPSFPSPQESNTAAMAGSNEAERHGAASCA